MDVRNWGNKMRRTRKLLGILFCMAGLSACTEGKPEFDLLSSVLGPTLSEESNQKYVISTLTESISIAGECPPQMTKFEISPDQGFSWQEPSSAGNDLDCSDGRFFFQIENVGTYLGFTVGISESKSLLLRGQTSIGETSSSAVTVTYSTSSANPLMATIIGAPSGVSGLNVLNILIGGTGVSSYKYKLGNSGTTDCSLDFGYGAEFSTTFHITDSLSGVADGSITLCVIGSDGTQWQSLAEASAVTWTKDSTVISVVSVSTSNVDGTYVVGQSIDIQIQFTAPVAVPGNPPTLNLNSGDGISPWPKATYLGGSGTNFLTFRYTVGNGESSTLLDYVDENSLVWSGAAMVLPTPGSPSSLSYGHNIKVNGLPADLALAGGNNYDFGSVETGSIVSMTLTLENRGGVVATVITPTSLAAPFYYVGASYPGTGGTCGTSLPAQMSCTLQVRFYPTTVGSFSGSLSLSYQSGASAFLMSANLTGTGYANPLPVITRVPCFSYAYVGEAYSCGIPDKSGIDTIYGDTSNWSIVSNTCGAWLSIDASTGQISGTPGSSDVKICDFDLLLSDGSRTSLPWNVHLEVAGNDRLSMLDSGTHHSCAIDFGKLRCWGSNQYGELGVNLNSAQMSSSYVPMFAKIRAADGGNDLNNIMQVSAGGDFTCALTQGGAVKCWGRGDYGQLGNGDILHKLGAVAVSGMDTGVVRVEAGIGSACALKNDGSVFCWGNNMYGNLGNGSAFGAKSNVPVQVKLDAETPLAGAVALSVGAMQACALLADGQVKCWGRGNAGQLGRGSTDDSNYAASVLEFGAPPALYRAVALSSGYDSVCAQLANGQVKCWGANPYGELGIGSTSSVGLATSDMASLASVSLGELALRTVSSLSKHRCAVLLGGELRCWGYNYMGQLGQGNTSNLGDNEMVNSAATVDLGTSFNLLDVSLGSGFSCARGFDLATSQNGIKCWGAGSSYLSLGLPSFSESIGDGPGEMGSILKLVNFSDSAFMDELDLGSHMYFDFPNGPLNPIRNSDYLGLAGGVRAPMAFAKYSGKWYFEVKVNTTPATDTRIGLISALASSFPASGLGSDALLPYSTCGFDFGSRNSYLGGSWNSTFIATIGSGQTIGFAVDLDTSPPTFMINTSAQTHTFNCDIDASVGVLPAATVKYSGQNFQFNFGPTGFYYGVPGGYQAGWMH